MNVLLRRDSNHERWNVDELLSNGNVSLSDQRSGVMDRVSELSGGNKGLKSSSHELVDGETENVIELSLVLLQQSKLDDSSDEGVTFEGSSWVVLIKGKEHSSGLSKLGEGKLDSPHFSLVLESVSTNDFELVKKSILIERLSWGLRGFPIICVFPWHVSGIAIVHSAIVSE